MKKNIFLYGIALALLIIALRLIEYRYIVHKLSMEFYLGAVALLFAVIGIWTGLRLTRKEVVVETVSVPMEQRFVLNQAAIDQLGISKREQEVLDLMAQGMSNQEIADKLFVSLNTIKTHSANLFVKLDVKRRTQAVLRGKELGLIP